MSPVANEPPPFLDAMPPPWAARALSTVLLVLFVCAVAALIVVSVPETISAAFVIEAARGTDPVRTLHDGTVSRVNIEDAQTVQQGLVMFLLASEPVGDRAAEGLTLGARIQGASSRAVNERERFLNRQRADDQEKQRLEQRLVNLARLVGIKEQELILSKEVAARMRQSADAGLSSWMEASKPQLEVERLNGELEQLRSESSDVRNTVARLDFEMASNRAAFDELQRAMGEETTGFAARKKALDQDPARRDGNAVEIASPCAGTVVKLHVRSAGAVVHEGDLLAEVVCAGEQLQAELELPERGLALIRVGQSVRLMYDAFPYERYGVHFGTLRWLSPASSASPRGAVFRALADLDLDTVGVEGTRRAVLPGMTGRAAVWLGGDRLRATPSNRFARCASRWPPSGRARRLEGRLASRVVCARPARRALGGGQNDHCASGRSQPSSLRGRT